VIQLVASPSHLQSIPDLWPGDEETGSNRVLVGTGRFELPTLRIPSRLFGLFVGFMTGTRPRCHRRTPNLAGPSFCENEMPGAPSFAFFAKGGRNGRWDKNGAPWKIRTSDLLVRSQTLYPAELRAQWAGMVSSDFDYSESLET
jgi:hypothetical protein